MRNIRSFSLHNVLVQQLQQIGDDTSQPITDAFDESMNTYWQAKEAESETFRPTIYINFKANFV